MELLIIHSVTDLNVFLSHRCLCREPVWICRAGHCRSSFLAKTGQEKTHCCRNTNEPSFKQVGLNYILLKCPRKQFFRHVHVILPRSTSCLGKICVEAITSKQTRFRIILRCNVTLIRFSHVAAFPVFTARYGPVIQSTARTSSVFLVKRRVSTTIRRLPLYER